jgi:hypothetical protein
MIKPVLLRGALLAAAAVASACDGACLWGIDPPPRAAVGPPAFCDTLLPRYTAMTFEQKLSGFKELSPKRDFQSLSAMRKSITWRWTEEKMVCLLMSVPASDLSRFKFELEYDGDNKDLVEYVFHDIDNRERQKIIQAHFATAPRERRVKVLTDVDDTFFANWVDDGARYAAETIYPGVIEFYQALHEEPFETGGVPITALSARPDAQGTFLSEEATLEKLRTVSANRLRPSGQSGKLTSSAFGSAEGFVRTLNKPYFNQLVARSPLRLEDKIGETKFANAMHFAAVFPEYRYVFVGDSGQADALTAQLLTQGVPAEGTSRPITTFIHDLTRTPDDSNGSPSFRRVTAAETAGDPAATGRAIIMFRNYIQAAAKAYDHRATLDSLIDAGELVKITEAALDGFTHITKKTPFHATLQQQYKADAQKALALLTASNASTGTIQQRLENDPWRSVTSAP